MSTFRGLFDEIPGIAVDRFYGKCLQSKYLFLSHCHSDHMVGLSELPIPSVPLYTSEVSAVFLQKQYPRIASAIEIVDIQTPLELTYHVDEKEYNLVVTTLPAKHCPGSVMFLFETGKHTVLYTGDFRIRKKHLDQYELLRSKTIDAIHLDSTFLLDIYNEFPSQNESIAEICTLINDWLEIHPKNKVLIEMPAQYGIEFIFIEIERKLKEKIHVNEAQWEKYVYLPAMDECTSPDAAKCRIFAKFKESCVLVTNNFRIIKPSAMFWSHWKRGNSFVKQIGGKNDYRVAYSNHCSYSELKDFLEFTQPKSVSLNVIPEDYGTDFMKNLDSIYTPPNKETCDNGKEKISFDNIFLVSNPSNIRKSSSYIKFPPKRLKL